MSDYFDDYPNDTNIKVWAKKVSDNRIIHANDAKKTDGPFYCPDTLDPLIVRKCIEKRDHFAYTGRQSNVYRPGESSLHTKCKEEILEYFQAKYPNGRWEKERLMKADSKSGFKEARPDISGIINNRPIIIEVQVSALKIDDIISRSLNYNLKKCYVLWLVPLKEDLGKDEYRPRLYEKYLHQMYFGRIYYWLSGYGSKVIPVHLDPVYRDIPYSEFYEDGELVSHGGYSKRTKTIFKPNYADPIDITEDFNTYNRPSFFPENERKAVPELMIYMDKLNHWWEKESSKPASFKKDDE